MPEFRLTPAQTIFSDGALRFHREAVDAALSCLVWSEMEGEDAKRDISREMALSVATDLADFFSDEIVWNAVQELNLSASDVGHNFYLSANGHGTGFWDRGRGEHGDTLHRLAKYWPRHVYVGDDGQLYSE